MAGGMIDYLWPINGSGECETWIMIQHADPSSMHQTHILIHVCNLIAGGVLRRLQQFTLSVLVSCAGGVICDPSNFSENAATICGPCSSQWQWRTLQNLPHLRGLPLGPLSTPKALLSPPLNTSR